MLQFSSQFFPDKEFSSPVSITDAHKFIQEKTCLWNEYLGWLHPEYIEPTVEDIISHAEKIRSTSDVFIVCGIGGSYLGARALIEAFDKNWGIDIVFLGNHLSSREYKKVFNKYREKNISACIISKSGTTLETALSYRLIKTLLLSKYSPEEVRERISVVTDAEKWTLKQEAIKEGYKQYILPDDIGGRYSVLTPVGLLPCAVAGIDIRSLLTGAKKALEDIQKNPDHPAFQYAHKQAQAELSWYVSEIFVTMEPSLYFLGEWWKQLMGESHGKEGKWLYPDTLTYTTDLHSLGQYVQEGKRLFFETFLWIKEDITEVQIPQLDINDGFNSLVGETLHELNLIAMESTIKAHSDGWCPSTFIIIDKLDEENIGYFLSTMMYSCTLSGVMMGVNPFNQPGVEAYKSEMRKHF